MITDQVKKIISKRDSLLNESTNSKIRGELNWIKERAEKVPAFIRGKYVGAKIGKTTSDNYEQVKGLVSAMEESFKVIGKILKIEFEEICK